MKFNLLFFKNVSVRRSFNFRNYCLPIPGCFVLFYYLFIFLQCCAAEMIYVSCQNSETSSLSTSCSTVQKSIVFWMSFWILLITEFISCNNPKASGKIILFFCEGNKGDANSRADQKNQNTSLQHSILLPRLCYKTMFSMLF